MCGYSEVFPFFFHWARGALPAGATLLGWPNYGVDGRLNKMKTLIVAYANMY